MKFLFRAIHDYLAARDPSNWVKPTIKQTLEQKLEEEIIDWIVLWLTDEVYDGEWKSSHEQIDNYVRGVRINYFKEGTPFIFELNGQRVSNRVKHSKKIREALHWRRYLMGEVSAIEWKNPDLNKQIAKIEADKRSAREQLLISTLRLITDNEARNPPLLNNQKRLT